MKRSGRLLIFLNLLIILVMAALPDIAGALLITEFPLPIPFSIPVGITAGPDGNVWFTEQSGNAIGQITPAGLISEFEVPPNPTSFDVPLGITTEPAGSLWFTESFAASIGQITTSGNVSSFLIPTYSQPFFIALGSDGNLWFTEESFPDDMGRIGRITPSGVITEFPVTTANSQPYGITAGPDGNLWFTEATGNNIGQITLAGGITEFALPVANSQPLGITTGPDGNLWFTEATGNNIGQITPAGVITEFPVPTQNSQPFGITTGRDGNLWFAEGNGNNIGLAVIAGTTIPIPAAQISLVQSPVVSPVIATTTSQVVSMADIGHLGETMRLSSQADTENLSALAPIGIGPVAAGGSVLTIMVGLGKFSAPVDLYFAFILPSDLGNVHLLNPGGKTSQTFTMDQIKQALSTGVPPAGLVPWVSNTSGGLYVPLLQNVPVSRIPSGTYTFYLGVAPAGNIASFYLWQTSFTR